MQIKAKYKGKEITIDIPDNKYWQKRKELRVSSYWSNLDNVDNRFTKEMTSVYKELEKELYTFIGKYGKDGVLSYSDRRVVELMKVIKPYLDTSFDAQNKTMTDSLTDSYKENYIGSMHEIATGIQSSPFVAINERAIKTAISFPWSGESFSDRLYSNKNNLIRTLRQEIAQGLIRGDSIPDMARNMGKRLDVSNKALVTLLRTETGAVFTASDKKSYEDSDLREYQFLATMDNRTSKQCQDEDGMVFLVKEMVSGSNAPPLHPRCRSTTTPYFDDGFGKRIAKNFNTGKYEYVDSKMSYKDYASKFVKVVD